MTPTLYRWAHPDRIMDLPTPAELAADGYEDAGCDPRWPETRLMRRPLRVEEEA